MRNIRHLHDELYGSESWEWRAVNLWWRACRTGVGVEFCASWNWVYMWFKCAGIYRGVQQKVNLEHTRTWNRIGCSMTARPPVLSPSNIHPPTLSHSHKEKFGARFKNVTQFFPHYSSVPGTALTWYCVNRWMCVVNQREKRLRWSRGSVLAFGTQVRGFAPGRSRRIFRAKKILSTPSFGGEVNPSVPCRSFTACKRSLNVKCKSAFRQNSRTFLAHSSTFRRWVLSRGDTRGDAWWRKLERLTQIAQYALRGCSA